MSLRCLTWVFHESPANGYDRLVLLAIADEADDDGKSAFPSQRRIAHKAHVGVGTVPAVTRRLEDSGALLIDRPEKAGRGHVNHYTVVMSESSAAESLSEQTRGNARERAEALPNPALTLDPIPVQENTPDSPERSEHSQDKLFLRLVKVCTGSRVAVFPEATKVLEILRRHFSDHIIDEGIGVCELLSTPPILPRYLLNVLQERAKETGTYVPDLSAEFKDAAA